MPLAPTAWPPPAPPRRPRRWLRILLLALLTTGVVVAAGLLWLAAVLSGGIDDLLSFSRPSVDDARVVEARERTRAGLDEERAALVDDVVEPVLGTSAVVATGAGGHCEVGQHNWKVDDPFDLSCEELSAAVVVGDERAFREQVLAVHDRLAAAGWRPSYEHAGTDQSTLAARLRDYWDDRESLGREVYAPADLPSAEYVRNGQRLQVEWVGPAGDSSVAFPLFDIELTTPAGARVANDGAGLLMSSGGWGAALVLYDTSFQE
ncbi:MAG: hypothetical protein ACLGIG_01700 [Actinomycetes bacterium]